MPAGSHQIHGRYTVNIEIVQIMSQKKKKTKDMSKNRLID